VVRQDSVWHRPTRPDRSRRSVTTHDTQPKPHGAAFPVRHCLVCGHRIDGTHSRTGTPSVTPATDPAATDPAATDLAATDLASVGGLQVKALFRA